MFLSSLHTGQREQLHTTSKPKQNKTNKKEQNSTNQQNNTQHKNTLDCQGCLFIVIIRRYAKGEAM
jgi:hypothetical protein